jgi:uncharacterized SAM-binding protein YcdF (DUF218 family)
MFFVSKVLPVFFFPLGVACLLIGTSLLAQMRRRSRLAIIADLIALAILWLTGNSLVAGAILRPLEMRHVPPAPISSADAIVVLGGCTEAAFPPQPMVHLAEGADRIAYAAQLYLEHKAPLVVLSGGGAPGVPESAQMAEIIEMLGVPRAVILEEPFSRNTHENAMYVKPILLAHHIHRVLLITSAVAMPRALATFKRQGIDALPAPTDFIAMDPVHRHLMGDATQAIRQLLPDSSSLAQSTTAIREYLGLVAYWLVGWI